MLCSCLLYELLGSLFGSAATTTIIGTGQPGLGDEASKGLGCRGFKGLNPQRRNP